jgi:hypothetical protein
MLRNPSAMPTRTKLYLSSLFCCLLVCCYLFFGVFASECIVFSVTTNEPTIFTFFSSLAFENCSKVEKSTLDEIIEV